MKSILNTLMSFVFLSLFVIFLPLVSSAQLATKIRINQNPDMILINVELSGLAQKKLSLNLSKQAEIIDYAGVTITNNGDAEYLLNTTDNNTAQIKYALKVDPVQIHYLTEDQNWYPHIEDVNLNQVFSVDSQLLPGYEVIHSATGKFQSGVSVVFGKFVKYVGPSKKIAIYLQTEDAPLASTLITSLESYLINYEKDFGAYPYDQFSVVESSDEIGYAFPRMTWMGSQLLRFPFILKTSLPHEFLHSWWGNSIFVNYDQGNWCEGLTVYGADYALLTESEKAIYRRKALLEYVDYVKTSGEISLAQFVSRGEDKSLQAIGYNKSLMMFVMLENLVGESVMKSSLKIFSENFKFKQATYQDLFDIIQTESSINKEVLHNFYNRWVLEKGAITFNSLLGKASNNTATFSLSDSAELKKIQDQTVEFLIYFNDGSTELVSSKLNSVISFAFAKKPVQFTVDPQFKLFRKMSDLERPISFSNFFATSSAKIQAGNETLDSLKQVFPNINFQSTVIAHEDFNVAGIVLVENYLGGAELIDQVLAKKSVSIQADHISIGGQSISLTENGYFIAIKVKSKVVILFRTNASLPVKRWFERWSHYGAQGFVVLSPNSAIKQGLWDNPLIQDLK